MIFICGFREGPFSGAGRRGGRGRKGEVCAPFLTLLARRKSEGVKVCSLGSLTSLGDSFTEEKRQQHTHFGQTSPRRKAAGPRGRVQAGLAWRGAAGARAPAPGPPLSPAPASCRRPRSPPGSSGGRPAGHSRVGPAPRTQARRAWAPGGPSMLGDSRLCFRKAHPRAPRSGSPGGPNPAAALAKPAPAALGLWRGAARAAAASRGNAGRRAPLAGASSPAPLAAPLTHPGLSDGGKGRRASAHPPRPPRWGSAGHRSPARGRSARALPAPPIGLQSRARGGPCGKPAAQSAGGRGGGRRGRGVPSSHLGGAQRGRGRTRGTTAGSPGAFRGRPRPRSQDEQKERAGVAVGGLQGSPDARVAGSLV